MKTSASITRHKPRRSRTSTVRHSKQQHNCPRAAKSGNAVTSKTNIRRPLSVVGVGASAGGLEAFTQLLQHLQPDTGLGFVLVQHLDPHHDSALPQILARATSMPVREAADNLRVEPNHVYVIPHDAHLSIARGVLKIRPRTGNRHLPRAIDSFFEALALDQGERAIGVILSGTASDGTLGLEAIKAEGGITFAQDGSAKYDSMPRSAFAAGCADFVMDPGDIAKQIGRIAKHSSLAPPMAPEKEPPRAVHAPQKGPRRPPSKGAQKQISEDIAYRAIVLLLREHSNVDFAFYKSPTVERRITRRMVLSGRGTFASYVAFLRSHLEELNALYFDVLINVTSFFRNPEAFEFLKRKGFPGLLRQRDAGPVRIWVPGCSTGQEAYSIAMAFQEAAQNVRPVRKLQVFATDLNDALLEKARRGLYPAPMMQDVAPERVRRFFVEEDGGYRVAKSLRDQISFARHNLISDPPFSRLDIISCRNLLIYLEPGTQKNVLPAFHYALKPHGFLLLGSSESVGAYASLFAPVSKKHKIFVRKTVTTPAFRLPTAKNKTGHHHPGPSPAAGHIPAQDRHPLAPARFHGGFDPQREADRITVNRFAPAGVLVNAELQVLQFRGTTSPYLQPASSIKASLELLKMAREGLMLPLRATLNKAKKLGKTVRKENVPVRQNGRPRMVTLTVVPLKNLPELCFLVLFDEEPRAKGGSSAKSAPPRARRTPVRDNRLERELSETRDYVQSLQEQHDAANEELQASNEEVQSTNEELQSINEELQTSKEEVESANEELTTLNEELTTRNSELNSLNADLTNLQTSTRLPILLVRRDLAIRRFSPAAEKLFNLVASDIGRPLSGVRHNLDLHDLEHILSEVIDSIREQQREVRDKQGHWYSLLARPYLTLDNKVDGAVLVLVDIDSLKHSQAEAEEARDYAAATVRTARDAFIILTPDMRVHTANEAFYHTFKLRSALAEGHSIFDLSGGVWDIPRLRQLLQDILPRNSFFNDFEVSHDFPGVGRRTLLLNARTLQRKTGAPGMILLSMEDVTERLESRAAMKRSELRYRRLFEAANDGVFILDFATGKITDANPFVLNLLGYPLADLLGKELWQIGLLQDESASLAAFRQLKQQGTLRYEDLPLQTKSGEKREVEIVAKCYEEEGTQVIQCSIRDITARKHAENALRESRGRLTRELAATQQLQQAGALLIQGANPDAVYQRVVDAAVAIMRSDFASLQMSYPDRGPAGELRLLAFHGFTPRAASVWEWVTPTSTTSCGRALQTLQRVIVPNVDHCHFMAGSEVLATYRETGIRAVQSTPLLSRADGRVVGMLSTHWSAPRTPGEDDLRQLDILARQAADLIERARSEEALRESELRFRALADNLPQLAWMCDQLGDVTWYNRRWLDYTGMTFEEMKAWGWKKVQHPDHVDRVVAGVQHSSDTGTVWEDTFPLRAKDGTFRWFLSRAFPIRDHDGKITRWFGTNTDITELREAQEALRQAKDRLADQAGKLEAAVQERTAQLQATIGELEHFSYTITHDMRAPLRAMQGFAGILSTESADRLTPDTADYVKRIIESAGRMDALIRDSLQYGKLIRETVRLTPVDPASLLRGIIQSYPSLQPPKVNIQIVQPLPPVLANEGGLTQCFSNLLTNAIKFVAPGITPEIRIWAELREQSEVGVSPPSPGREGAGQGEPSHARITHQDSRQSGNPSTRPSSPGFVRFWFEDNGIGIPTQYQRRIFEMFQQLDKSYEGTGIGLALVRKAAERMGGRAGVESEPCKGSRFWLDFKPVPHPPA